MNIHQFIIEKASEVFQIEKSEMLGTKRKDRHATRARAAAALVMQLTTDATYREISNSLGFLSPVSGFNIVNRAISLRSSLVFFRSAVSKIQTATMAQIQCQTKH